MFLTIILAATLTSADRNYLSAAMQAELGRYAMGTAAASSGTSRVKAFGRELTATSARETRSLDALAKRYGVPIPKSPNTRDTYHYSQLQGLRGRAFDQLFAQDLRIDDEMLLSRDQYEAAHGSDPRLVALAKHRVSVMQHELKNIPS